MIYLVRGDLNSEEYVPDLDRETFPFRRAHSPREANVAAEVGRYFWERGFSQSRFVKVIDAPSTEVHNREVEYTANVIGAYLCLEPHKSSRLIMGRGDGWDEAGERAKENLARIVLGEVTSRNPTTRIVVTEYDSIFPALGALDICLSEEELPYGGIVHLPVEREAWSRDVRLGRPELIVSHLALPSTLKEIDQRAAI